MGTDVLGGVGVLRAQPEACGREGGVLSSANAAKDDVFEQLQLKRKVRKSFL